MDKIGIRQAVKDGYIECQIPGCADFSYPISKLRRGRVQGGYYIPYDHNDKRSVQDNQMGKQIIILGYYDNGTGKHQSNTVYSISIHIANETYYLFHPMFKS